jgi:hypothetical protein
MLLLNESLDNEFADIAGGLVRKISLCLPG